MTNRTWPSIAVVGAGAIGCYFGGMLARAGMKVTLIGRGRHVDPINRNGLRFQSSERDEFIPIAATEDIAAIGDAGLILFCVKSLDTEDAARAMAPHVARDAVILSLQNGVDNVERIRAHVTNPVLPVLVYAAAQMTAPGMVEFTGGGNVVIGRTRELRAGGHAGPEPAVDLAVEMAAVFAAAGVPVKVSDNIEAELWTKLVMNCAYNAICAITGAPYGRMVAMPEIRSAMRDVVEEVVKVAAARSIRLPDDIFESTLKLAEVMPITMSSTARDLTQGKRTEIDHLNGTVVRLGETLGVATPANRMLNALIKLLEQTKLDQRN